MSADTMGAVETSSGHREPEHRGVAGPVLAGIGALLLVVGALIHFYAVPKLAVAPSDVDTVTHLAASGATIFDTGTLKPITTDLSITNRTVGNVAASKAAGVPKHVVVWASLTTIRSADGTIRSQSTSSSAMNDKTSVAVNCCGNFTESSKGVRTPTKPTGLVYKFPFGTKKQTYMVWDGTLGKAVKTTYAGTTTRDGMKVYEFDSTVPASVVGQQSLPGSIFGIAGSGEVQASSYYQNTTRQWVEPTTGAIIDESQNVKNWFQAPTGEQVTTTQGTIHYTTAQVATMVSDYKGKVSMLKLSEGFVPWLVMLLGLGLIGGGVALGRKRS